MQGSVVPDAAVSHESIEIPVHRRFIRVNNQRHVHYRRAGSGPPIVLVHATPSDSSSWLNRMQELGRYFTCYAFDTPGFGRSDALPEHLMNVTDIGDSIAETMRALGLPKCPVLGTHTGAAVSLELASRHSDMITGAVLDGLGLFDDGELEDWFDGYFVSMTPSKDGGHLTDMWTRFRDQSIWFPWQTKLPEHLMNRSPSPASRIHDRLLIFYLCAKHYEPAYRSAVFYGKTGVKSAKRLDVPAVITASKGDVLYSHLDRLPVLKANQTVHRFDSSIEKKHALELASLRRFESATSAPPDSLELNGFEGVGKQLIDTTSGHLMVRYSGRRGDAPVVLLHDAPGSSLALEPIIESLGRYTRVFAFDFPGCGESTPLRETEPSLSDYANCIADACEQLGVTQARFYGAGVGASVAIEVKKLYPALVSHLALNGVLLPSSQVRAEMKQNATPAIEIKNNGSHWYDTWMMLRDSLIWHPWYERNEAALRRTRQDFSAERMHNWMMEVMKQRTSYHHVIQAAITQPVQQTLREISGPTLICQDPRNALSAAYDDKLSDLLPAAKSIEVSESIDEFAQQLGSFFSI